MDCIEEFFWRHIYGDWESLKRPFWIYGHVSILLATALLGYAVAREAYLIAALLVPFPLVYLYKRYEKARTYKVQSETTIEPGEEYDPDE